MNTLYNIKLTNNKEIVYNENLPFINKECNNLIIEQFITYIRPSLIYNNIEYQYVRDLHFNEHN